MDYAREKTSMPGLALLIVGLLTILGQLAGLIWQGIVTVPVVMSYISSGAGTDVWISFATSSGLQIVSTIIGFFCGFIILFSGTRLRAVRSAGIVYAGAIMAALPCCSGYCCCIGLPIAIWAIVTMQDEQVKAAFAE
jgi:hypothetical protein